MNPRQIFERLFGGLDVTADPAARARQMSSRPSILDIALRVPAGFVPLHRWNIADPDPAAATPELEKMPPLTVTLYIHSCLL
jgi:hypothetical protein